MAHKVQQCNNFKDPSVQLYGGDLFHEIQDKADDAFNTLPPPTSALRRSSIDSSSDASSGSSAGAAPAPVSMAAFNDRYAGCIAGDGFVELAGGGSRRVADLAKGDKVIAWNGDIAEVAIAMRLVCPRGRAALVEFPGGARLTPYHPVHVDGAWRFPADVGDIVDTECEAVYSFVLDGSPALVVNGVACVALGHGIEVGAAAHGYFGTQQVVEDLKAAPRAASGHVDVTPDACVRDPDSGLVCGLAF